jgi:hypothetical protein
MEFITHQARTLPTVECRVGTKSAGSNARAIDLSPIIIAVAAIILLFSNRFVASIPEAGSLFAKRGRAPWREIGDGRWREKSTLD